MKSVVVVGNPKPMSRTRQAAELLTHRLTGSAPDEVIDVIDLGVGLLGWGDPGVAQAVDSVKSAQVLVVASPTYKATYTGLLKLFLDQFGAGSLRGIVAFPLMLGAAANHALAPELLLKPVLVEIGCHCPTQGLYLLDSDFEDNQQLTEWLDVARTFVPVG
jgi:FMN reductase